MPQMPFAFGQTLYYERISGEPDLPTLIFLHEGLGCCAMWKAFPQRLCKATGCSGLVYDRLGYGRSSQQKDLRNPRYLHDYALIELPQVISSLLSEQEYILVGHSDGGSIAMIYGANAPSRLKGIVTEAAHVFVDEQTLAGIAHAVKAWKAGKLKRLYEYHGTRTEWVFEAWHTIWLSSEFRSWNIESFLSRIEVPLLVIQGAEDQYGSLKQVEAIVSKTRGDVMPAILRACAHVPHLEAQEETLSFMANFIQNICKK
ncbi:MAG: alpha/beta hydrolase [Desulfobacterales bacterium]|nr:alpha/beta hydrolase [Desulfobacterales bacterium]